MESCSEQEKISLSEIPEQYKKGHQKAEAMLEARVEAESHVSNDRLPDTNLLAAYLSYIKIEEVVSPLYAFGLYYSLHRIQLEWPRKDMHRKINMVET